jgi:hypothetical protein
MAAPRMKENCAHETADLRLVAGDQEGKVIG